jgi:exopolysaccharide biosynthesis WecB/TagA/CpsF family protein
MATTIAAHAAPVTGERFLSLTFHQMPLDAVLAWVAARDADSPFAYVVTPNVDHMVRLEAGAEPMRQAFENADLRICDSRVLSRLAKWCGVDLPVVPGSDLIRELLAKVFGPGDRLCLIGGTAEIAHALGSLHPGLEIVQHSPPMGLLHDPAGRQAAIAFAAQAHARAVLLAVGAPQQEVLAWEMRASGRVSGTGLCIGASIDFLIGVQSRAPAMVRRAGFEWAWRLMTEPKRLWRRYLVEGPAIFPIVWRWARSRHRSQP